jgi:hypothetical protein
MSDTQIVCVFNAMCMLSSTMSMRALTEYEARAYEAACNAFAAACRLQTFACDRTIESIPNEDG